MWFVFAGMGTQWPHMGRDLMTLDCFRESIMRSDSVLRQYGIQLCELLMDSKDDTFNDTINSFVGIAAIQVSSHISDSGKNASCSEFQRKLFAFNALHHTSADMFYQFS